MRSGDSQPAQELYGLAAEQEVLALRDLPAEKVRTRGITTVSAAALYFKAQAWAPSQRVIHAGLASGDLPDSAVSQLRDLLQEAWVAEANEAAGVKFLPGEVRVSVSGGQIVPGGAPMDLVQLKVDQVGRTIYRVIEMLMSKPLRLRGEAPEEVTSRFVPWLFQAPAGSYQFAVRVERPEQLELFPDLVPAVSDVTNMLLNIIEASAEDPLQRLPELVPDEGYRKMFLRMTRNLAPTGKVFGKLEVQLPAQPDRPPVVLLPTSREMIQSTLKQTEQAEKQPVVTQIRGVLRGVELDRDWISVSTENRGVVRISQAGEVVDDLVGPMVNHHVVVDVVHGKGSQWRFRDIQLEE